jgi:hypothetical protein
MPYRAKSEVKLSAYEVLHCSGDVMRPRHRRLPLLSSLDDVSYHHAKTTRLIKFDPERLSRE